MKVLLLGPALGEIGGVSNYYNVIKLHEHQKVDYFPVTSGNPQNHFQSVRRLIYNYVRFTIKLVTQPYEIIHVNPSFDKRSFFRDSIFMIIGLLCRKKIIVFFRGWQDDFELKVKINFFLKGVFKLSFAKADIFIVLGNIFKNKLLSLGVNPDSKFIIETTIADDSFIGKFNLDNKIRSLDGKVIFLFMARILKEKGIYIAIDAFYEIVKSYPTKNFELVIAGEGPELPLVRQYIKSKNIPNTILTGFIDGKRKGTILEKAHIFLFPTYYGEGLPNCILEAMLYGMPIVSRNIAAISDWVLPGINGFLTKSLCVDDYIPLIERLLNDKVLFNQIARNNHITGKEQFTKKQIRKRIFNIYKDLQN